MVDTAKATSLLNTDLQSGYNYLRDSGMNDQQVTDWYNSTYGTKISAPDVTAKFSGGYTPQPAPPPIAQPAPTNNSQQVVQDFQSSLQGKVYDINGNPITLPDGYSFGGSLFQNTIMDSSGISHGQYYTSPGDADYWKQKSQDALSETAVVGPQTLDQQRQQISDTLNRNGLSQDLSSTLANPGNADSSPGLIGTVGNSGAAGAISVTPGSAVGQNGNLERIGTESVSNRILGLIDPNSPLMVQAKTQALQQANARGLLNSSIATSAAEEAMLNKAESIATADATLSQEANKFNANWANDMYKTGVAAANDIAKLRVQGDIELAQIAAKFGNDSALQNSLNGWKAVQADLDRQLQTTLQSMKDATAANNTENANKVDALLKANALMTDTQKYIADITANKDMDDASKSVLIQKQIDAATMAVNGYSMLYGEDLSDILNFDALRPG